jgi:hypothetical protein
MRSEYCCEEMREFVRSCGEAQDSFKESKVYYDSNGTPEEVAITTKDKYVPNIIFRFCPYCGTLLQKNDVPETNDTVIGALTKIVFNKELDDNSALPSYKNALLQDSLIQLRSLLKNAAVSGKPATGFIKTS